ncbi:Glycosyltransferase, catalytic subunit of cellulose synthase and poly-beta-1,6-N-acetylglucosamine synthase [Micromonospora citrea]|uniref:Glycosyltransferase, catalytic subunit of cellulose synthase and poly-beta-1,6-N-acetylglucosamine synthase n=1 Tax=Micromonospora citrea TaxID=47855 RepID=A0A1C6U4N1_9ACTN|nr:glycosyltransferase [Micromonospora citrea]SCL48883.1 Glycosyltransferase, catalytic subunit of cellulose synthase and poly-beta-1,6-N-acetylglucosamine synthase [Micromonospora citrea]
MISIVVPTLGRPSLAALLDALAAQVGELPDPEILLVDDRRESTDELAVPEALAAYAKVLTGPGAGPAAARNVGWRAARSPWIVFLDDDVVPAPDWARRLLADLRVGDLVGGVQGRVHVPLPEHRRPTDWERGTAGLAEGEWITADMAYRRDALADAGGFDERFPRAYREDAELAHRVRRVGWDLVRGERAVTHPVRPEDRWVSLRVQRGNADDALLRRLYGPHWRTDLRLPTGRRHRHVAVTAAGALALAAAALRPLARGTNRTVLGGAAVAGTLGWAAGTAEFARARIAPGPRTADEVATMLVTSAAIPPLAVTHWVRGWWRSRAQRPGTGR